MYSQGDSARIEPAPPPASSPTAEELAQAVAYEAAQLAAQLAILPTTLILSIPLKALSISLQAARLRYVPRLALNRWGQRQWTAASKPPRDTMGQRQWTAAR